MLAQLLHAAKERLRRLPMRVRGEHAARAWFREYWYEDDGESRGLKLLREWLSPEQLVQFERKGHFDVTGCHTGRRYRIQHGISMNVHEIDSVRHPVVGWCFVPNTYLVAGDGMLAQKITLETDERAALAVATSFSPKGGGLTMFVPI